MKPFVAVLTATGLNDKNRCKSTTFLIHRNILFQFFSILENKSKICGFQGDNLSTFCPMRQISVFFSITDLTKEQFFPIFAT